MRFGHHALRSRDLVLSHSSDEILMRQIQNLLIQFFYYQGKVGFKGVIVLRNLKLLRNKSFVVLFLMLSCRSIGC
jgi:hypothetical protein